MSSDTILRDCKLHFQLLGDVPFWIPITSGPTFWPCEACCHLQSSCSKATQWSLSLFSHPQKEKKYKRRACIALSKFAIWYSATLSSVHVALSAKGWTHLLESPNWSLHPKSYIFSWHFCSLSSHPFYLGLCLWWSLLSDLLCSLWKWPLNSVALVRGGSSFGNCD